MIEIADVFRRFADDYLSAHGATILPSHRRAIADILACRTEALGGHLWRCDHCSAEVYSYHSCKNRSCPKCHADQTERWLASRKAERARAAMPPLEMPDQPRRPGDLYRERKRLHTKNRRRAA